MSKACRVVKRVVHINSFRRLQVKGLENIPELSPKMYAYIYIEFNTSIPKFIHIIVRLIFMNML